MSEPEMQKIRATVTYHLEMPKDVFDKLEARDDGSLTELVSVMVFRSQTGTFRGIRAIDEDVSNLVLVDAILDVRPKGLLKVIDWEHVEEVFDWEGVNDFDEV